MTIATTIGSTIGNTAAYSKHYVLATGINGKGFVSEVVSSAVTAYALKDAELAERREEMRRIAAANGSVRKFSRTLPAPTPAPTPAPAE